MAESSRIRWIAPAAILVALVVGGGLVALLTDGGSGDDPGPSQVVEQAPQKVKRELGALDAARQADAVVITGFESSDQAAKLARESRVGGLLVGPEDWFTSFKGRTLLSRIEAQAAAAGRTPPLVVGRQEGGIYRAYSGLPPAEGQRQIGDTGDPARARSWAAQTGRAMAKAGFDLNLAPIADVSTLDSPLSDRAFSDDPELVTVLAGAAARGCRESGLACGMPYFPGLGAASQSTLDGPATVGLDAESMRVRDLAPFEAAIRERVPALVLSLALYSAYDPITPAALSPAVATGLLRDELGYKGVAIADDLSLGFPATGLTPPEAAVRAVAAGSDMVVVSNGRQAGATRKALAEAAESGVLPRERLEEAAARALSLRQRFAE
jgi:beta-N-acetylhexosaminidase